MRPRHALAALAVALALLAPVATAQLLNDTNGTDGDGEEEARGPFWENGPLVVLVAVLAVVVIALVVAVAARP